MAVASILREQLLTFAEAGESIPGHSKITIGTLHRWRKQGVRGVVLETVLVGGRRMTSREAISRFIEAQNAMQPTTVAEVALREKQKNRKGVR